MRSIAPNPTAQTAADVLRLIVGQQRICCNRSGKEVMIQADSGYRDGRKY